MHPLPKMDQSGRKLFCLDHLCEYVVYDEHRAFINRQLKLGIVLHSARAPALPIVNDLGHREMYPKLTGTLFHTIENLLWPPQYTNRVTPHDACPDASWAPRRKEDICNQTILLSPGKRFWMTRKPTCRSIGS